MKINTDAENMYYLFDCASLVTHDYGLVGMDWQDLQKIFNKSEEMYFYTADGENIGQAYTRLKPSIENAIYNSAFLFLSIKESYLDCVSRTEIEDVFENFSSNNFSTESEIIWNVYPNEQEENCRIYLFCGKSVS